MDSTVPTIKTDVAKLPYQTPQITTLELAPLIQGGNPSQILESQGGIYASS